MMRNATEIAEINKANFLMKGSIHPDTNEVNPPPMRVSSFLYTNMPIVLGMLLSKPTIGNTMFWQFAN